MPPKRKFTESSGVRLAKILLKQIESENPQCAQWLVSAVDKLTRANPRMSLLCLRNILATEMPNASAAHQKYIAGT